MKKNILKVTLVAAIVMACGISFLNSQKSETLSDIALANVEAFADMTPTGNRGPAEMFVCAGGNGTKRECMCRNERECTTSPCS